jgi:hypothetical protein
MRHNLNTDWIYWGKQKWIPLGIKVDHALAVLAIVTDPIYPPSLDTNSEYDGKVYMVGQGDQLPEKTTEEIQWEVEEEIARANVQPGNSTRGRGITACRMTLRLRRMSTRMELLHGGTILSSTHDAAPTEIDSDTDHDRSMTKSIGLSTKESKFTALPTHNALASRISVNRSTPHLPKDNKEVNAHVKCL